MGAFLLFDPAATGFWADWQLMPMKTSSLQLLSTFNSPHNTRPNPVRTEQPPQHTHTPSLPPFPNLASLLQTRAIVNNNNTKKKKKKLSGFLTDSGQGHRKLCCAELDDLEHGVRYHLVLIKVDLAFIANALCYGNDFLEIPP